ncbi:uncharacterized protein BDZ83DRAFT_648746 [Colletotrichum acutatum]|uniref:Uncharacterized protein n=1 Tax=Glomerella acutata TaxID=27357 RepID=A0AAD8XIE3_GLOAC|nr:uncharacterized protein BDZ83DRAFT_648746 [Colletotrichum acutatum]KAK1728487.1 hypothetical protein BDZ83DRAFT_648746 [Colletotrichum acutatum]
MDLICRKRAEGPPGSSKSFAVGDARSEESMEYGVWSRDTGTSTGLDFDKLTSSGFLHSNLIRVILCCAPRSAVSGASVVYPYRALGRCAVELRTSRWGKYIKPWPLWTTNPIKRPKSWEQLDNRPPTPVKTEDNVGPEPGTLAEPTDKGRNRRSKSLESKARIFGVSRMSPMVLRIPKLGTAQNPESRKAWAVFEAEISDRRVNQSTHQQRRRQRGRENGMKTLEGAPPLSSSTLSLGPSRRRHTDQGMRLSCIWRRTGRWVGIA